MNSDLEFRQEIHQKNKEEKKQKKTELEKYNTAIKSKVRLKNTEMNEKRIKVFFPSLLVTYSVTLKE